MRLYNRVLSILLLILILIGGSGVSIHDCCECVTSISESVDHKCCSQRAEYGYKHRCVDEQLELDLYITDATRTKQTASSHTACYILTSAYDVALLHFEGAMKWYGLEESEFIDSIYDPSTGLLRAPPIGC